MYMSISAKCHCGQIEIIVRELPEYLGHCNCSICRRYEALWGYYPPDAVSINLNGSRTSSYIWGDREVEFHRCENCGCITHYSTTELCPEPIVAVNFRMVEPSLYKQVFIKEIDGASY
jgi:hypothetical protein